MKKKINTKKSAKCKSVAPVNRNRDFYNEYIEGIVSFEEKKQFEKHLENCLYCSRQTVVAIKLDKWVEKVLTPIFLRKSLKNKLEQLKTLLKNKK